MAGVLFWNLRGHDLSDSVSSIARGHHADIIVLAECPDSVSQKKTYARKLSKKTGKTFRTYDVPGCRYLHIVTSLSTTELTTREASKRYAILQISEPGKNDLLLAFAHLPPKGPGPNSAANQRSVAEDFHQRIQFQENAHGHRRTIVAGDLNMDPFETGMIDAKGLHGVSSREVSKRIIRKINDKRSSPMFFNPMWGYAGDSLTGPPGTYYKSCSMTDCLFWHLFDQVLVRHEADSFFDYSSLKVLDNDGLSSLLTASGIPNKTLISDHLPIVFTVNG